MCYSPIKVVPKRYYDSVEFKGRFYDRPIFDQKIYNANQRYAYYPCGKCYECRENYIEQWQIRWKEHLKDTVENSTYMLTLTYDDKNLPHLGKRSTLQFSDVQKFLKRLRKRQYTICKKNGLENPKIAYHGCGEYGTKYTKRPHYHLLITNVIIDQKEFEKIWSHGFVHIGDNCKDSTIKYILKYTLKSSLNSEKKQRVTDVNDNFLYNIYENGKNKGRVCEKTFCSKGIGRNFLTPQNQEFYQNNPHLGYNYQEINKKTGLLTSKLKPLPRYYKELIFNPNVYENGKIKRDDHDRPIKLYNPKSQDFENTPRFKRLLVAYKNEQHALQKILDNIINYGYDNYLAISLKEKQDKHRIYKEKLQKRELEQEYKNYISGYAGV